MTELEADCLKTGGGPMAWNASSSRYLLMVAVMQCELKERHSSQGGVLIKSLKGALRGGASWKTITSLSAAGRLKKGYIRVRIKNFTVRLQPKKKSR